MKILKPFLFLLLIFSLACGLVYWRLGQLERRENAALVIAGYEPGKVREFIKEYRVLGRTVTAGEFILDKSLQADFKEHEKRGYIPG